MTKTQSVKASVVSLMVLVGTSALGSDIISSDLLYFIDKLGVGGIKPPLSNNITPAGGNVSQKCFPLSNSKFCGASFGNFYFPINNIRENSIRNSNEFDGVFLQYFNSTAERENLQSAFGCKDIYGFETVSGRTDVICRGLLDTSAARECNRNEAIKICKDSCYNYIGAWTKILANSNSCKNNSNMIGGLESTQKTCSSSPYNGESDSCLSLRITDASPCDGKYSNEEELCKTCNSNPTDTCCIWAFTTGKCSIPSKSGSEVIKNIVISILATMLVVAMLVFGCMMKKQRALRNLNRKLEENYFGDDKLHEKRSSYEAETTRSINPDMNFVEKPLTKFYRRFTASTVNPKFSSINENKPIDESFKTPVLEFPRLEKTISMYSTLKKFENYEVNNKEMDREYTNLQATIKKSTNPVDPECSDTKISGPNFRVEAEKSHKSLNVLDNVLTFKDTFDSSFLQLSSDIGKGYSEKKKESVLEMKVDNNQAVGTERLHDSDFDVSSNMNARTSYGSTRKNSIQTYTTFNPALVSNTEGTIYNFLNNDIPTVSHDNGNGNDNDNNKGVIHNEENPSASTSSNCVNSNTYTQNTNGLVQFKGQPRVLVNRNSIISVTDSSYSSTRSISTNSDSFETCSNSDDHITKDDCTGKTYKVAYAYFPQEKDELLLTLNDEIKILNVFSDGWAYAKNVDKQEMGVVPLVCLEATDENKNIAV